MLRVFLCLALIAWPSIGLATHCGPRDQIVEKLSNQYGEKLLAGDLNTKDALFEVYASPETGTWTATVSNAHGIMCIISSGSGFEHKFDAEEPTY